MTNEEKAKELDEKFKSFLYSPKEGLSFQQCLLEMAEWKDKQFKEYLEKCIKTCEKSEVPVTKLVFEAIIKDLGL